MFRKEAKLEIGNTKLDKVMFHEIEEFLQDSNITDICWNGYELWIDNVELGRYKADKKLSDKFIENFTVKLGNLMHESLNKQNPYMEAETENLRITIYHESTALRRSIAIRIIPLDCRLSEEKMIKEGYATKEVLAFLRNCIIAHLNTVIGGRPGDGKTEFLKYLCQYIPDHERAITIEDNREIHYRYMFPERDSVELKITEKLPYSLALKGTWRHMGMWNLLSEARGPEVYDLMNNLSSGSYCITTMHLGEIKELPDRMYNMAGIVGVNETFLNEIHSFIDVGVRIEKYINEENKIRRKIKQIALLDYDKGVKNLIMIYDNERFTGVVLPDNIRKKFENKGIKDPFQ